MEFYCCSLWLYAWQFLIKFKSSSFPCSHKWKTTKCDLGMCMDRSLGLVPRVWRLEKSQVKNVNSWSFKWMILSRTFTVKFAVNCTDRVAFVGIKMRDFMIKKCKGRIHVTVMTLSGTPLLTEVVWSHNRNVYSQPVFPERTCLYK